MEYFFYLLEINRLQSISAAAKTLHIGQTTLSNMLKIMEDKIGFPIFQRTPTGVMATSDGQKLMVFAREIRSYYESLTCLKSRTSEILPFFPVAMTPSISSSFSNTLSQKFSEFEIRGNLQIDISSPSSQVVNRVVIHSSRLGMAFLSLCEIQAHQKARTSFDLTLDILFEDCLYAYVPMEHPMAKERSIPISALVNTPYIALERPSCSENVLQDITPACRRVSVIRDMDLALEIARSECSAVMLPGYASQAPCFRGKAPMRLIPLESDVSENKLYCCLLSSSPYRMRHQEQIILSCIKDYFSAFTHEGKASLFPAPEVTS